ncbi:MAG: ABC transporter ATP-binding protein, partial [Candidatus Hydrothermae bacterium]|nr:ABC transporter ATP-binding protein [Candidatus Hydrothermae bacterium]
MADAEILLQVDDLSVVFPGENGLLHAIEGISFELHKGETLGIVGESGSGKSMTALSLMQLLPSTGHMESGSIRFTGEAGKSVDLARLDDREMRKYRGREIGMIFQEPMSSLNPVFRCGAQVDEVTRIHLKYGKEKARAHTLELFRKVQLPDPERIYHAFPHQLSGGQKQRVMIAMAMAAGPRILIADEPTTALDVTVQKAILDLMAELREETDAAVIFITHDLGVVAEIADRVLVMDRGKIVEQSTV